MGALRTMVSNHKQDAPPVRTRSLYYLTIPFSRYSAKLVLMTEAT